MSCETLIPIKTIDSKEFKEIARFIEHPTLQENEEDIFYPAWDSFTIGEGLGVDISFLLTKDNIELPSCRKTFDRHLYTEELWVALEGDFYMPAGLCENPEDHEECPKAENLYAFHVHEGDMFVLKPNVWHSGPWCAKPNTVVKFIMLLCGHRSDSKGERVDNILKDLPDGKGVIPLFK